MIGCMARDIVDGKRRYRDERHYEMSTTAAKRRAVRQRTPRLDQGPGPGSQGLMMRMAKSAVACGFGARGNLGGLTGKAELLCPTASSKSTNAAAIPHDRSRQAQAHGQCDPLSRHGCGREGQVGPSRHAHGHGRCRHGALHPLPEIRRRRARLGRTATASCSRPAMARCCSTRCSISSASRG